MSTPETTLTDRYIAAAVRTVPEEQRDDLAAELRGSIADQVDARIEQGESRESAERAVLIDLGDPDKLAAGYTDRPLWLIGPRYYLDWWRLLKVLWAIVPVCAVFGVALAKTIAGDSIGEIIAACWVVLLSVIVHIGFWTTLVFFVVERSGTNAPLSGPWTPDSLPEPRVRGLGFGELVTSLVFLVVAAGAVVWDHVIGFVPGHPGLSFLDDGLWPWWIAALFVLMALEAVLSVVVYLVGRWTVALAVANAVLALAFAIPALWLLVQGRLLNPDYLPTIIGEGGAVVQSIVVVVTGFTIAGITLWDILDAFLKARRSRVAVRP